MWAPIYGMSRVCSELFLIWSMRGFYNGNFINIVDEFERWLRSVIIWREAIFLDLLERLPLSCSSVRDIFGGNPIVLDCMERLPLSCSSVYACFLRLFYWLLVTLDWLRGVFSFIWGCHIILFYLIHLIWVLGSFVLVRFDATFGLACLLFL